MDHPFFVFNRGWSSCNPSKTFDLYGLPCLQLAVGDICISLTERYPDSQEPPPPPHFASDRLTVDEFLSSPKSRKSSRGSKTSPPDQSPEPQATTVETGTQRGDEDAGHAHAVSPAPGLGPLGRFKGSRKRRWSAPDNGTSDANFAEPSLTVESNQEIQSSVALKAAGENVSKV